MTFDDWLNEHEPEQPTGFECVGAERMRQVWNAAINEEREACANELKLTRSEALLMAGEMTAQEWRTVAAVLRALQARMRPTSDIRGCP